MTKALLIEDEPLALDALRSLLDDHPRVEIVGEARDFRSARTALIKLTYDLVFLDIVLIGGNAFDLVPLVQRKAKIIFVTAYNEHAVRAFEVNALDFLCKPVSPARLALSLRRIADLAPPKHTPDAWLPTDTIFLNCSHSGGRFVPVTDIVMIRSSQNYTEVVLQTGRRCLLRRTMKAWEDKLPAELFYRVHRLTIINLAYVESVEHGGEEDFTLYIKGLTAPIHVSRRLWAELKQTIREARVPSAVVRFPVAPPAQAEALLQPTAAVRPQPVLRRRGQGPGASGPSAI